MQDRLIDTIKDYYLSLPFNKVLGISIEDLDYDTAEAAISFSMKPDLIGNFTAGILHGGVTASVIDLTGGLSALISCVKQHQEKKLGDIQARMTGLATINMRVDYLRPGKGRIFECRSRVIRAGSRIAVSRIDLFNEARVRIATGTATYMMG